MTFRLFKTPIAIFICLNLSNVRGGTKPKLQKTQKKALADCASSSKNSKRRLSEQKR